jgi:hypothetical protein
MVLNIVTILGFLSALYWVYQLITYTQSHGVEAYISPTVGWVIMGVPFTYVVSSLFMMSIGGAYHSFKGLAQIVREKRAKARRGR